MTTSNFEGLADELILQICSYLDQPALAALSLANQRYRRIAQEILYKTPSLIPVDVERYACCQSVYAFCRTLLRRPDFAQQVRQLTIRVPSTSTHYMESELEDDVHSSAMGHIREFSSHMDITHWSQAVGENWTYYSDGPWTGLLLCIVPNLVRLELKGCDECYINFNVSQLFGLEEEDIYADISLIKGLASLSTLAIPTTALKEWDWCTLPNLKHIELECIQDFEEIHRKDSSIPSSVETLSISCSTGLISDGSSFAAYDSELYPVLARFPNLKHLCIKLTNVYFSADEDEHPERSPTHWIDIAVFDQDKPKPRPYIRRGDAGSFANFFKKCKGVSESLRSIDIRYTHSGNHEDDETYAEFPTEDANELGWAPYEPSFRTFLAPTADLGGLESHSLDSIALPQEAFYLAVPRDGVEDTITNLHPLSLPSTLKELRVYDPTPFFLDWLAGYCRYLDLESELKRVVMEFVFERCEEFRKSLAIRKGEWKCEVGLEMEVLCRCHPGGFVGID